MITDLLANPILKGTGTAPNRDPSPLPHLPAGIELVSADDHWEVTEDIFHEQLPEHLKELGPRVWFNRIWWNLPRGADEGEDIPSAIDPLTLKVAENGAAWRRGYSREQRLADLEAEGMRSSIVFPNSILAMLYHPNLELREEVARIYNRYIARESAEQRQFHGVGMFPNWWDETKAEQLVQEIVDLGLKTFMLPTQLRLADGSAINFADKRLDRFWAALERSGLPLCFHVGENFPGGDQRGVLGHSLQQLAPFRLPLGQLIFGGVFERHPGLQVVFAEGGFSWVAPFLQDAEMLHDTYGTAIQTLPKRPTEYWRANCYATFQTDLLGLARLVDVVGADRVMWGADYPHTEGTFGFTANAIRQVVENVGATDARLILGGTAKKVFRLN